MEFRELLRERITELENLLNKLSRKLLNAPEGHLRISKKRNKTEYYLRGHSDSSYGRYLKKDQIETVKKLAQKEYHLLVKKAAEGELAALRKAVEELPAGRAEEIYESLSPERQKLVDSVFLTDEEYRSQWENASYERKGFVENAVRYSTPKGVLVRSKSEWIIIGMIEQADKPCHYEKPLKLSGQVIYPDFTVLNVRTRKTYYWEHFGMMDDPIYAEKAVKKIALYMQNRIFPGDQLILTFESKGEPLRPDLIKATIEQYLT